MSVQFSKAYWRSFWFWYVVAYFIDAAIIGSGAYLLDADNPVLWAFLCPIALYVFLNVIYLYYFCVRVGLFFAFERSSRTNAIAREMKALGMPPPDPFYNDVDEYLTAAAGPTNPSDAGRMAAGVWLGMLYSLRQYGPRAEGLAITVSLEGAIQKRASRLKARLADSRSISGG